MMRSMIVVALICLVYSSPVSAELTLEQIMAHPDWIGNGPEGAYWSDDGESVFFRQKVVGEDRRDLKVMDAKGGEVRAVPFEAMGEISVSGGDWSRDGRRKVYAREGDIYVRSLRGGDLRQLTQTAALESAPAFMADESLVQFTREDAVFVYSLESGLVRQALDLRTDDDPLESDEEDSKYIEEQQARLIDIVRLRKEREDDRKERAREEQRVDSTRAPVPWYLGEDYEIATKALSSSGDFALVGLINDKERTKGKADRMPNYVTESSYTESMGVRSLVGTTTWATEQIVLLDLKTHEKYELDLSVLDGIYDDPLEQYRKTDTDEEADAAEDDDKKPRATYLRSAAWSPDGRQLVLSVGSRDNKDRWIASVDLEAKALVPILHEQDEAWINRDFRLPMGWLDDSSLYFVSEQHGYAHVYVTEPGKTGIRQLTSGDYVVGSITPSRDGAAIYYSANVEHPGIYEVYRVDVASGNHEQLTALGGLNRYVLSPDEKRLLISHSSLTRPAELHVQRAKPGAEAKQITHSLSDAFEDIAWSEPEIVAIPSSHQPRPIYSRVYSPEERSTEKRPAVVFVHGAGYLQNAHQGWSNYFREFMFHSLLVERGYVVLDMDYRASAGYGRDWRTAIYRQMGTPELEDLQDGVEWLVDNRDVDSARIGVYGGSYGGFMTLMALFRDPDLFACGAALRPVTDWAHYNHGYTSNILNIPELDPAAYENSSPIEFAEGLTKPLLICHGMLDNNVFYQDSVRLVQRLIELEKEDWEFASYPAEAHGFREPSSWLDEYRRILKLFETHLK